MSLLGNQFVTCVPCFYIGQLRMAATYTHGVQIIIMQVASLGERTMKSYARAVRVVCNTFTASSQTMQPAQRGRA